MYESGRHGICSVTGTFPAGQPCGSPDDDCVLVLMEMPAQNEAWNARKPPAAWDDVIKNGRVLRPYMVTV